MVAILDFVIKETSIHPNNVVNGFITLKLVEKEVLWVFIACFVQNISVNMATGGHFGFPVLSRAARLLQTGVGAYSETNTLKYQTIIVNHSALKCWLLCKTEIDLTTHRRESLFSLIKTRWKIMKTGKVCIQSDHPLQLIQLFCKKNNPKNPEFYPTIWAST